MIESSGILILSKDKILLCHSTDIESLDRGVPVDYSVNRWGIPKGKIDGGESSKEAALRETLEETGLDIKKIGLEISDEPIDILRFKSSGDSKIVYVYFVNDEFGVLQSKPLKCTTLVIGTNHPENDKFMWATKTQAKSLIYRSQLSILNKF